MLRSLRPALLWSFASLCTQLANAQIRVLSPKNLVQDLGSKKEKTLGKIQGSTSTFGAPFYGDRVLGRLVYGEPKAHSHCNDADYTVADPQMQNKGRSHEQARLINVILVRRGECTFVTKVRIASAKGAHAVIIVDKESSTLTSKDIQNIIVADDGYGATISIPSILVSKFEGDKLIASIKAGNEIVVELAWEIPTDHVVAVDLWMSSASQDSQKFVKQFAPMRKTLNEIVKFTPHYHVFSADPANAAGSSGLCWDSSSSYCAEDPDGSGLITGRTVLEEDVRQLCIHEKYRVPRTREGPNGALPTVFFSEKWWNYVMVLVDRCPVDSEDPTQRFGKECAEKLMKELGIDVPMIRNCIKDTAKEKLESERMNKAWSPRALRVNGWRYKGMLDADLVTRAVCSGFVRPPPECETLLTPRDPTEKYKGLAEKNQGISFGSLVGAGLALLALVAVTFCLYRRFIEKRMRTQIQEEVMLEVHNQMASYRQLAS